MTAHAQVNLPSNLYTHYAEELNYGEMPINEVESLNHKILSELKADLSSIEANLSMDSKRLLRMNQEMADQLLRSSFKNKIVSPKFVKPYDPYGNIGFCFGRALYFHLELLRMGYDKSSIRKAWMIGPINSENLIWQFHVATIVRGNNDWIVLDTEFKKSITLTEWYNHWNKASTDGKVRIYITEPQRFGASALRYNKMDLTDSFYNNYFDDMFKQFKNLGKKKQISRSCSKSLFE